MDGHADPGHAGGVGAGEVVTVAQRDAGGDLDLAAEVDQERAVADLAHLDAVERLDERDLLWYDATELDAIPR